jgi:alpha-ketoglutarate-dependent taurine dioxygenase
MSKLTLQAMPELDNMAVLLQVEEQNIKATDWVAQHKDEIEQMVRQNGMLLIRGLNVVSSKQFSQVLKTLFGEELADYGYRSTPRTELRGNVYTATEYHSGETISQHNECAYSNKWPMRIGFVCLTAPQEGGATPLCDSRKVYQHIPDAIKAKFVDKSVMYVRNYGDVDLPWQEVFQTDDKKQVEQYCDDNDIQYQWHDDGRLSTKQVNPATAVHPHSGEEVWFNQAHLFHYSALSEQMRDTMLDTFDQQSMPRNAFFGDGTVLNEEELEIIREAYQQHTIHFKWQKQDVLLLDNMMFTHGRQPFKGDRKVLVGMAQGHGH